MQASDQPTDVSRNLMIDSPFKKDLVCRSFSGNETIGRLFDYRLGLVSKIADLKFKDIVGKKVTVSLDLPGDKKRYFNGYVTEFMANGGLTTPGVVNLIGQEVVFGTAASSGSLILGTVTFHLAETGATIAADFGLGGFLGADFTNRTTGALGSVTANIIPEPTTISLVSLGILGLVLAGRGHSRRR